MANKHNSEALFLCDGKGCAKKQGAAWSSLAQAAEQARVPVTTVSCLGSCEGPTAIVSADKKLLVFERLQSTSAQSDLVSLALETSTPVTVTKRLKKRELTGKRKKKALKRLAKQ